MMAATIPPSKIIWPIVREHVLIHASSTRDAAVRKASKAVLRSLRARMGEDDVDGGVDDTGDHKWLEQTRAAPRRKGTHTNTSGVGGPNGQGMLLHISILYSVYIQFYIQFYIQCEGESLN